MDPNAGLSDYLNLQSKTSTFLSIDVMGSTSLKAGEAEQDVIYTFLAYHRLVKQVAYDQHGEVMNISGDGIMCRFEFADDTAAAVQQILAELPAFNKRQNRLAHPFQLRLGVHTGEVYQNTALASGQIISHTVDVAAKLQQSAPPNLAHFSQDTISRLKQVQLPMTRIGWNAELNTNVYQYGGNRESAVRKRTPPDPIKILMVEDELDEVLKLKKILRARRHDPFAAYNLNQAALGAQTWGPHVIMISADLPWDTGWEFLQGLRSDASASNLPVLIMSRQATGQAVEKCFGLGANGFLTKPLEEFQVVKRLDMVVREFYL